jgi:hypothetical protein
MRHAIWLVHHEGHEEQVVCVGAGFKPALPSEPFVSVACPERSRRVRFVVKYIFQYSRRAEILTPRRYIDAQGGENGANFNR